MNANISNVTSYTMDTMAEADEILLAMSKMGRPNTMHDVEYKASMWIKDPAIKRYFLEKGRQLVYGSGAV
ncbi:hypothetical protein [Rhizobium skierniewicense]|uniref:hypothetical protein n=1 Tax=Rhizobium skierniewicense TaxID=984260 RepID=UPI001572818E|nr:hypothetical protein [Rhizobium skierniewicense]NTF34264.1 hypothetical protein [Rhizobium skierniewicense]